MESLGLGRKDGRRGRHTKIAWGELKLPTGFNWGMNPLCFINLNMTDKANYIVL